MTYDPDRPRLFSPEALELRPCPKCKGTGRISGHVGDPCPHCSGRGTVTYTDPALSPFPEGY